MMFKKAFLPACLAAFLPACLTVLSVALLTLSALPTSGFAHCQIPCGIYDDGARIERMVEDTTTIEKAIKNIDELAGKDDAQSANQLTRWIMIKEDHASDIITTVAEYFLTQKVKPVAPGADGYDDYLQKLADHHRVMRAAMKAKQNADLKYVKELREAIAALGSHYGVQPHEHK
jgi:nickel superoxide dismutase